MKKPTPKLNTPKGNPFGGAPVFGQAPFGPNAFGNPAPLSNGKTGLGFLEPKQTTIPGATSDRKSPEAGRKNSDQNNNLGSDPIEISGFGSSQPIDLSKGAQQSTQSQSNNPSSSGNISPGSGIPFSDNGGSVYSNDKLQLRDVPNTDYGTAPRDRNAENNGVRGIGKQDPSALTFNVKPVVTNYPTNQDSSFDPNQADTLVPVDDPQTKASYDLDTANGPDQGEGRSGGREISSATDSGYGPSDIKESYNSPSDPVTNYNPINRSPQDKSLPYGKYGEAPNQRGPSVEGIPRSYDPSPNAPSRAGPTNDVATGVRGGSSTGGQTFRPEGAVPDLNAYPGSESANAIAPPPRYYNTPKERSDQGDKYSTNNDGRTNTYNADNKYGDPQGYGDARETYPSGNFQNNAGYGNPQNNKFGGGQNENDDLRSNEVRDAIGPEGLKTKGIAAPDGLDGSRLRGNKEPVGQGADFVGTSLLADGDYLDRSSPGR